ncbi:MAG: ferredoxin--NADP reductase [Candidatus Aenigmatarchaeota archaeon]
MIDCEGEIIKVIDETHDVKTLRVKLDEEIEFKAGQYCLLSFPEDGDETEARPFTLSNPPTQENPIEFTVKKMGDFTSRLHNLEEGDKINATGPYGDSLIFDETIDKDVVFISGGSGITPFISAIRLIVEKDLGNNVVLVNSNRTKDDIIYRSELKRIEDIMRNVRVVNTLTQEIPNDWDGEKGRIDKRIIRKYVSYLSKRLWYICGPPPMVDSMKKILLEMNIKEENIRAEDWQLPGKHDQS